MSHLGVNVYASEEKPICEHKCAIKAPIVELIEMISTALVAVEKVQEEMMRLEQQSKKKSNTLEKESIG